MTLPQSALLLAEEEQLLALDRRVLRGLGVTQTVFFSSGRKALDHMQAENMLAKAANDASTNSGMLGFGLIICNERLEDMTGITFLSRLRSLRGLEDTPAVLLVSNEQGAPAIAARASNSCTVLARPYSSEQASKAMHAAMLPESRHVPMVLPPSFSDRFVPRLPRESRESGQSRESGRAWEPAKPATGRQVKKLVRLPGEAALEQGINALKNGDFPLAQKYLYGSYDTDPDRVETSLAISRLYALQHNEDLELTWLCRAGVLCLKRGEKTRAANLLSRLPRGKPGQVPLLAEAGLMLQEGEIRTAALTFLEAYRLDPSQPLHALIGRSCIFTHAPEEHMRALVTALEDAGHSATASKLHMRLFQPSRQEEKETNGFFDRFPILGDIINVATYTFKTWRHAA